MEERKIEELDQKIDRLTLNVTQLTTKIDIQEKSMVKLMEGLDKLTTYIEKTNENNKKIDTLFKMVDRINTNGTKNCPLNINRIDKVEKRLDRLEGFIIYIIIAILLQFLGIVTHLVDKHIHI